MQLYSGSSPQFIEDTVQNQIAGKLRNSFFDHFRYHPSDSEVRSWHNSLTRIKDVFQRADLMDHGVVLEYQLPLSSKRLDCMIMGKDVERRENAVIVELKQWDKCEPAEGENEVSTWTGHGQREVLHPSVQVGQYEMYLKDAHTAFYEGPAPVQLHSCSYLHNYSFEPHDLLLSSKYRQAVKSYPLYSSDDVDPLCGYLSSFLKSGDGMTVLARVQQSKFRPSKKLLDHVSGMIKSKSEYVLLDEQLVAYDSVLAAVKRGFQDKSKTAILINGGPGTGKSVIAINLMADLSRQNLNAQYATGSKSFTTTLRKIIGPRGAVQFKYFNSYMDAGPNEIDVLICDESHRIRKTSANRFTPKTKRTAKPQLEELLHAAKVPVFLIDDLQVVRPAETGSSTLIRETAQKLGYKLQEYRLETQFRCSGSDAFVNWIDNTLDVRRTANSIWEPDEKFEFKIFDSPTELETAIREKVSQDSTGRVTAGYCWKWSLPDVNGIPLDDVVIGDYRRPWDVRDEAKKVAKGIPKASLWAYHPNGINQVGCVYTAQGFEFDYVGVIVGLDIRYDPDKGQWIGDPKESADPIVKRAGENFLACMKNTYRVLFSRGLKGCYVYFMDRNTRNFFISRTNGNVLASQWVAAPVEVPSKVPALHLIDEVLEKEKYVNYLPVYSLAAAAGGFSDEQTVRPLGWAEANGHRLAKDMFIARVKGKSMEPTISDGSYCIFRWGRGGSRNGKVVLVQCQTLTDPESSGQYTVKRYESEKELFPDGTWKHKQIVLSPDNKDFQKIILRDIEPDSFKVVAEYVSTLG